jgi:hypothetical protein
MASINSIRVMNEQGTGSTPTPVGANGSAITRCSKMIAAAVAVIGAGAIALAPQAAADRAAPVHPDAVAATPVAVDASAASAPGARRPGITRRPNIGSSPLAEPVRVPIFPVWHAWRAGGGIFCWLCHHKA